MMPPTSNDTPSNGSPCRATDMEDLPSMSPMSLVGLQERAMHYQDLAVLVKPSPASRTERPPSHFETLHVEPGQDYDTAFHRHLVSVLEEAVRIIHKDDDPHQ